MQPVEAVWVPISRTSGVGSIGSYEDCDVGRIGCKARPRITATPLFTLLTPGDRASHDRVSTKRNLLT